MSQAAEYDDAPPSRRFTMLFALAMTVIALGWVWVWHARTERVMVEPPPPVAVAGVEMPAGEENLRVAFMERLADSFAQIRGLTVLTMPELYAITGGDASAPSLVNAARQLDVPNVLQGTLLRTPRGYRLELQRLDAQTRAALGTVTAEGATHEQVLSGITAQLAMSLGLAVPPRGALGERAPPPAAQRPSQ